MQGAMRGKAQVRFAGDAAISQRLISQRLISQRLISQRLIAPLSTQRFSAQRSFARCSRRTIPRPPRGAMREIRGGTFANLAFEAASETAETCSQRSRGFECG